MGNLGEWLYWIVLIVLMGVFLFLPQWMARRRQRQKVSELRVGDRVVTIGGFVGVLTQFDLEANEARIRLAEGCEVEILPGAVARKHEAPAAPVE